MTSISAYACAVAVAGAAAGVVTISGESTVFSATAFEDAKAGIRINTDGTIDKRQENSYTQISSTTDWIDPNGDADSTYQFRVTSVTWGGGSSFDVTPGTDGDWFAITSAIEWSIFDTDSSAGGDKDVTFTIEARKGTGATLDSGAYSLDADRLDL